MRSGLSSNRFPENSSEQQTAELNGSLNVPCQSERRSRRRRGRHTAVCWPGRTSTRIRWGARSEGLADPERQGSI